MPTQNPGGLNNSLYNYSRTNKYGQQRGYSIRDDGTAWTLSGKRRLMGAEKNKYGLARGRLELSDVDRLIQGNPSGQGAGYMRAALADALKQQTQNDAAGAIKPFDESGYWDEANATALADAEYDPYYARLKGDTDASNAEENRLRREEIGAAGGLQSSAAQREYQLRRTALQRAAQEMEDERKTAKLGFVSNRRNDAFQRYLQGIGGLTSA